MTEQEKQAALDNIVSLATLQVGSFGTIEQYNRVVRDTKILRAALSSPPSVCQLGEDCDLTIAYMAGQASRAPAVPVIDGLEEAIKMYGDIFDRTPDAEHPIYTLVKAASAYARLPKMQKVDLDGMRRTHSGYGSEPHSYNAAIDDIKSKHGELYYQPAKKE